MFLTLAKKSWEKMGAQTQLNARLESTHVVGGFPATGVGDGHLASRTFKRLRNSRLPFGGARNAPARATMFSKPPVSLFL